LFWEKINPALKAIGRICVSTTPMSICLSLTIFALGSLQPVYAQPSTEEYKVKAAFIFHFAQLVDWPPGALGAEGRVLNLCVFEDEPHIQELQNILDGKLIGSRILHVRLLNRAMDRQECSILFLSSEESRHQAETLRNFRGEPVLTIGENENFLSDGGIIRLHLEGGRIRFDVNVGAAELSRLKISSRLLILATSIIHRNDMKGGQ
jgi:hypothetical protein